MLLVIVRHGQSQWNLENRFTGEVDIPLTDTGRKEALEAGKKLKGIVFGTCFTSQLVRAQETLRIILEEIGEPLLPVIRDRALNERNYGQLQGLNKTAIAEQYGAEQVALWRRSYDAVPPGGESLEDTVARVVPYYRQHIEPLLAAGQNILVVAHGNSLRALMMHLEKISPDKIALVDIPTGSPRAYRFDDEMHLLEASYM